MYWSGFSSSWPFSHTWIHETAPTYLADELFQPADLLLRTRLRLVSTISLSVRRTRLLTVSDRVFLLPFPAPGTTCRATSRPHHLCLFSEAVWRRTSSGILFRNFCSVPAKWLLSLLTLWSSVLLTYLSTGKRAMHKTDMFLFCSTLLIFRLSRRSSSVDWQSTCNSERLQADNEQSPSASHICRISKTSSWSGRVWGIHSTCLCVS